MTGPFCGPGTPHNAYPAGPTPIAGLARLTVRAASGCIVFEEPRHAPLELELSHVSRLLAAGAQRWTVRLGLHWDEALQQRLPELELVRLQAQPG